MRVATSTIPRVRLQYGVSPVDGVAYNPRKSDGECVKTTSSAVVEGREVCSVPIVTHCSRGVSSNTYAGQLYAAVHVPAPQTMTIRSAIDCDHGRSYHM